MAMLFGGLNKQLQCRASREFAAAQNTSAFVGSYQRKPTLKTETFHPRQPSRCSSARRNLCKAAESKPAELQRPPKRSVNWGELKRLQESGEHVSIEIEKVNRSGAVFSHCGVDGFLPYSLMDYKHLMKDTPGGSPDAPLEYLVSKKFTVQLTDVDEAQNRLIGSEQAILFAEFTSGVKKGDVVEGVIGKCTDFGAFVKLGAGNNFRGVQGLIHISELSWNKIFTPEAVVTVGDFVRCKVLSINPQKGQINLSLKQMEPDPLLERLDTVLPESKEQLAFVPTELPSTVEDILGALKRQPGIDGVSIGRQAEERAVSQDLEIWISTTEMTDGFGLIVRAGRLVQEITLKTTMSKDELRDITQRILKQLA